MFKRIFDAMRKQQRAGASQRYAQRHQARLCVESLEERTFMDAAPVLNSNPGAPKSIYLDFDGHFEPRWGEGSYTFSNINIGAFDSDGIPGTFSGAERNMIREVWAGVAEDFAPFNVNVTTVDPGGWNVAHPTAVRVVIGGKKTDMHVTPTGKPQVDAMRQRAWDAVPNSGIAIGDSFNNAQSNTVFVFARTLVNAASVGGRDANGRLLSNTLGVVLASTASHEAGHAFGLGHQIVPPADGQPWTQDNEYNPGTDTWTPIMGNCLSSDRTTWSNGRAFTATGQPVIVIADELGTLADQLGYRADDHGDWVWTATALPTAADSPTRGNSWIGQAKGIIGANMRGEINKDADFFSFTTSGGQVTANTTVGANLEAKLELWQVRWVSWGSYSFPVTEMIKSSANGNLSTNLAQGTYYLAVKSRDGGYGNLGQYTLRVNSPVLRPSTKSAKSAPLAAMSDPPAGNLSKSGGKTAGMSLAAAGAAYLPVTPLAQSAAGSVANASLPVVGYQATYRFFEELGRGSSVGLQVVEKVKL